MTETFRLGFRRAFRAEHTLIGGDWGDENLRHGHDYVWEIRLTAVSLDRHGYLVDLVVLEQAIERVLAKYRGTHLNDQEAFRGVNPSLERFARQLGIELAGALASPGLNIESLLWENQNAWASWFSSSHP